MTALRLHLRRSAGRRVAGPACVLTVGHLLFRPDTWRHEWHLAMSMLAFVTIFLGPLAAGVGAWEGGTWGAARPPSGERDPATSPLFAWVALCVWTLLPFGVGLLLVLASVPLTSGLGPPPAPDWALLVPPVTLLVGAAAGGVTAGWYGRLPWLVAPLVAMGACAASILAFVALPGHLTDVGAATGSLIGLRVRPEVTASQVVLWASVVGTSIVLVAGRHHHRRLAGVALSLAVLAGAYRWQVALGPDRLEPDAAAVRCVGDPALCLAPGYERYRGRAHNALAPTLDALDAIGAPLPLRFTQDAEDGLSTPDAGVLSGEAIRGSATAGANDVVNAFIHPACSMNGDREWVAFHQLSDLYVTPIDAWAIGGPPLRGAPPQAVRDAIEVLRSCRS